MSIYGNCSECGASLDGGEIPQESRHLYGLPYRWSRAIAIYSRDQDRTVRHLCPDCGATLRESDDA